MRIFAYLLLYMIFHGLIFRPDFYFLLNFIFLQEENVEEDLEKKKHKPLKMSNLSKNKDNYWKLMSQVFRINTKWFLKNYSNDYFSNILNIYYF